jgi:F-type H+-transporting ATPase subunit gamma
MAKARAIMKRRKAVRNIKKITRTMQMIATAKFQKSLKRSVGTKPYTMKVRELVREVAASAGNVDHPLLRRPGPSDASGREAVVVITSNRGLAGGYNGHVLRKATALLRDMKARNVEPELYVVGKKGASFFKFQKQPIKATSSVRDVPAYAEVEGRIQDLITHFTTGQVDAVHLVYMNFITTGTQKAEAMLLLPLAGGVEELSDRLGQNLAEKEAQIAAGSLDARRRGDDVKAEQHVHTEVEYDFSPSAAELLGELLPLTVKTAFFQAFLDATTSEHVARMVAMKSASDNAEKISKALALEYNRARQGQITTELSEIMGGVEAMNG